MQEHEPVSVQPGCKTLCIEVIAQAYPWHNGVHNALEGAESSRHSIWRLPDGKAANRSDNAAFALVVDTWTMYSPCLHMANSHLWCLWLTFSKVGLVCKRMPI